MNGISKRTVKMAIDLMGTFLLLTAMGFRITGTSVHEIVGAGVFVFVFVHNVLNRRWYAGLLKGRYGLFRIANAAINVILTISMLVLLVRES